MTEVTLSLIVLRCRNLAASLDFYRRLGLRFAPEQHGNGPLHYAATLNDTVLELYPQRESGDAIEPLRIGFAVSSFSDSLQALQDIGVEIKTYSTTKAVVLDPDGRTIDLTERNNASQ